MKGEEAETEGRGESSGKYEYASRGRPRKKTFFQDGNYLSVKRGSGER